MKLVNLPVEISWGDKEPEAKAEPHTEDDELHDSEDATQEEKDHVKSVLGFDLNELFKDE